MATADLIKEISLGPYTLRLLMHNQTPLVERDGEFYNHIWLLCQQLPLLSDPAHISIFAEIANFLWKGLQFQFIDQIADYQRFYNEQVDLERRCPTDIFQFRLTDFKIFDVSVMHEPRIDGNELSFFVYHASSALPYRVVSPFPYIEASALVHYQILPIKSEATF